MVIEFLIMYRYIMCIPGRFQLFFDNPKKLLLILMAFIAIGCVPTFVVGLDLTVTNITEFLTQEAPVLTQLSFGPNVGAFHRNLFVQILGIIWMSMLIAKIAINKCICIVLYRNVQNLRASVLKTTYQMQKMLFLSVLVEDIISDLTTSLPLAIVGIILSFPIPYASHCTYILFILMSFHTFCTVLAQCYFIRPFRKCISSILSSVRKFICRDINIFNSNNAIWAIRSSTENRVTA
jgi:hypothetical protein